MKNLISSLLLVLIFSFFLNCKKEKEPVMLVKQQLESIREYRFTPDDSMTIRYNFDQDSMLVLEENSKGFSIKGLRDQKDISQITNGWVKYRLYSYNSKNQLTNFTEYFLSTGGGKAVSKKDSSIYLRDKLVRQELRNYRIDYYGGYGFNYPLWLTKRYFKYNDKNQLTSQTDSIFITHDIAPKEIVIIKSQPKFAYTNEISYEYNSKGDIERKVAISNEDTGLLYSNGASAYNVSHPGILRAGTTYYSYTYDAKGYLTNKTALFKDPGNGRNYESFFLYCYKQ